MSLPDSDTITARLRKVEQLIALKREFVDPVREQLQKQKAQEKDTGPPQPETPETNRNP